MKLSKPERVGGITALGLVICVWLAYKFSILQALLSIGD